MAQLAELQSRFARALRNPDQVVPQCTGRSNGRFDVYRNNMMVNTIDALQITYPAVKQLVGDDFFRAVAKAYIQKHPPRNPVLLYYGENFGSFLEEIPSASKVPYLGDVARLEWLCASALHASDVEPIGIEDLGEVPESLVDKVTLTLHPSLGLLNSRWPVVSLRAASLANAEGVENDAIEVDMKVAQQALVIRPDMNVVLHAVPLQHRIFFQALQNGVTIGESAALAMESVVKFDLASVLRNIFLVGAVTAINVPRE